jgi:repressor LexA
MKRRSTETMKKIRDFSEQYFLDYGRSPSTTLIANEVDVSRGTAYKYLVEMNDKGLISYDGKKITTPLTQSSNADRSLAPIVGAIRCGSPEEEREEIKEYVSLPASIFGYGDFFILTAKGDSMNLAGIDEGDLIVVEKGVQERVGDIVVALDDNNCNTLKRLAYDKGKRKHYLQAESSNPANHDLYPRHISVQGVARNVIKKL